MSFPQPNADLYALAGADYFRLNTPLVSAGDLYESQQSCHALALGPESDISRVNVNFLDSQSPQALNGLRIGPVRDFVGRVDALNNSALYLPSNRPGRVLIWPDEIYDPNYIPNSGFNPDFDVIQFITPQLDVIQYFKPPVSLQSQRVDKTFYFQDFPLPEGLALNNSYNLMIPYYGRRYAYISFTNWSNILPVGNIDYEIVGVNFAIALTGVGGPFEKHGETVLLATTAVNGGSQQVLIVTAPQHGMFDMIRIRMQRTDAQINNGPTLLKVVVSDNGA